MRLIDADAITDWIINELRWTLFQKKGAFDSMTGRQAANVIGKKLDDAPTIDAIPVEWLKKIQAGCVCDTVQVPMYVAIGWLIDMWQKEQEAR